MRVGTPKQLIVWLLSLDSEKLYEVREYRKKRTLTQNAYYWQLLSQVADALRMSKTELHNRMIRDYGQIATVGGTLVTAYLPDTIEGEKMALQSETYHLKPTYQVRRDRKGIMRRTYVVMRGSSDYDTKEMSILVDGLIQEAKQLGIETLTPAELEEIRMHEIRRGA